MTTASTGTSIAAELSQIDHLVDCVIEAHDDAEYSLVSDLLQTCLKPIERDRRSSLIIAASGHDKYEALKLKFEP